MKKTDELARLAGVVFEGAEPRFKWAAMDKDGKWYFYNAEPENDNWHEDWYCDVSNDDYFRKCQNQPSTDLPWQETLICRSDYPELVED